MRNMINSTSVPHARNTSAKITLSPALHPQYVRMIIPWINGIVVLLARDLYAGAQIKNVSGTARIHIPEDTLILLRVVRANQYHSA